MNTVATNNATFRPRARLLSLLGEQLISDQAVGLIELVKNSYDADATRIDIHLTDLTSIETTQIVLRDNGFGMSRDDIEQKWLSPAIDHKERQKKAKQRTPRGRLPIGEKGVGRFAVHQLGRRFQLVTRSAGASEVVLVINWDDFESGDVFLEDVPVTLFERTPELFTGNQTGTYLCIHHSRSNWTDGMVAKVQRALRRLQSPHEDAGDFTISLSCPDYPSYEHISSSDILERAHYVFRGLITSEGWLDYEYRCLHPALSQRFYEDDSHHLIPAARKEMTSSTTNSCGPLFVTFYVWDRTQEFLNQSGVSRADLDAMSGVSLFRDGLRVLPYGEAGNDWLDLDRERINDPSKRVGNQQIIGFVEVQQAETPGLRDKTNREGLIDNSAFRDMRALVRATVNIFTTQWLRDRPKAHDRPRAPRTALDNARVLANAVATSARDDVIVQVASTTQDTPSKPDNDVSVNPGPSQVAPPQVPDEPSLYVTQQQAMRSLLEHLQMASIYQDQSETDATQRTQVLMHLAATGMAAERVSHEFGRQVHAALEALGKLRVSGRGDSEAAVALRTLDACLGTLRNEFRVLAPYEAVWRLQRTTTVSVRESVDLALKLNERLINQIDISFEIEGDDFYVDARSASLAQVFDNLIHNACMWLDGRPAPRYIRVLLDQVSKTVHILDSGPGIPDHLHNIVFDPFVSLRNGGRGLGLYIARELLKSIHASIILLPSQIGQSGAEFVLRFSASTRS